VTRSRPASTDEPRFSRLEHERPVGEVGKRRRVASLGASGGIKALGVQQCVDLVGRRPAAAGTGADVEEAVVVGPAAQRAGAVAGGERRPLVEDEELGEPARLQEALPFPPAELEPAGDPAQAIVVAADAAAGVVQAAAISVDEPAARVGDQLAEWRDAVLEWHCDAP
jgi:hypothetical protein